MFGSIELIGGKEYYPRRRSDASLHIDSPDGESGEIESYGSNRFSAVTISC